MNEPENSENRLPGGIEVEPELKSAFQEKAAMRGEGYVPRTRHLDDDGRARYINRLFLESSPYLLQHAHNPVNWYPWGDEAFAKAQQLNRPVLVSIGYSTCHWCHVMEEESFEDEEVAAYLNTHFIAVKVDREERPDVDAIYMAAVQALNGSGGWPLNVMLMPDRKPFWGGTYFPARDGDRGATMGFLSILKRIHQLHVGQPDQLAQTSVQLTEAIRHILVPEASKGPALAGLLDQAASHYRDRFDRINGGLGGAPKFPSSLPLRFLFRYYRRSGRDEYLKMAVQTLDRMAAGGMYDQAGGGFHRYSVDAGWQIPHFEKMLYDNALLAVAYLEGYQITGRAGYRRIVDEILRYVTRDMTSPRGAFYSATDADSLNLEGNREEGYFFTWTPEELEAVLGFEKAAFACKLYNVRPGGNFEGRSILNRTADVPADELDKVTEINDILYRSRKSRPAPIRDEKILTAWNGLMISAYARAGWVLNDRDYTQIAETAATFILNNMMADGRLFRSYNDGRPALNAYLEDYAFFAAALLDLFETTWHPVWFEGAAALDRVLETHFEDRDAGGFFATADDHDALIAREKPNYDGATPSGNSVALLNLLRLGELTGESGYRERFQKAFNLFLGSSDRNGVALSEMLLAADFVEGRPSEIVIVEPAEKPGSAAPFLDVLRERFVPNRVLVVATDGNNPVPIARERTAVDGVATVYICREGVCRQPVTEIEQFHRLAENDFESEG